MEIIIVTATIGALWLIFRNMNGRVWNKPDEQFPPLWRTILTQKVPFYNALSSEDKKQFEYKVQEFLLNYQITGVETDIDINDKLLVAASGIIPIFKFPAWHYTNLQEVIIYPGTFNLDFETTGPDRRILGMVGTGPLNGKMILSQKALHHGFAVDNDKRNTAIHEFIHLIDKIDGSIDGIPKILLERPYVIPWLNLIHEKMEAIYSEESDINRYGGTSKIEFFAVSCEYFFEQPKLMAKKHPDLYKILEMVFDQDMKELEMKKVNLKIGRNSPCPCQSGKKYKKCCGLGV